MSTTTATSAANLAALANASVSPLAPVVAPVALGLEYERDASHVKKCAPFVQKIYGMVSEPEIDAVVTWTAEGNSFVVLDTQAMQDVILPRYFKHNNFASFVRQLNMYGFRKVGSPSNIEFYQDSFLRGRTELLVAVKRRKPGSSKAKKAAAAAAAAAKGGKVSGEAAATFSADIRGLKRQRVELEGSITSLRASQDRLAATLTKVAADNARLQADLMASRERHQEMSGAVQSILALLANAFPQAAGMVAANTNNTTTNNNNNNNHFGAGRVTPTPSEPVSPMSTSTTTTATTFVPSVGVYNDTHDDPHAAPMSMSSDLASEDVTASLSDAPPAKRAKTAASVAAGGSTLASTGYLAQANHQHGAGGLAGLCRDQQVYASAKAEAVAGLASSVETPMALPSSCNQDSIWQAATNLNLGLVGRNEVSSKAMAADQHLGVDFLFDEATFDDIFATPTAGAPVASAESVVPTASPRAIDAAHMSVQAAAGDFGLLFDLIGSN